MRENLKALHGTPTPSKPFVLRVSVVHLFRMTLLSAECDAQGALGISALFFKFLWIEACGFG